MKPSWSTLLRVMIAGVLAFDALFVTSLVWKVHSQGETRLCDFSAFYCAAGMAADGAPERAYDYPALLDRQLEEVHPEFPEPLGFSYPPYWLATLRPLRWTTYHRALVVWVLLQSLLFLVAILRLVPHPLTLPLALAFPGLILNLSYGQNGALAAALLCLGLAEMERRPAASGISFALLAFKPQLAALVPVALLAGRRWRVLGVTAVAWTAWVTWSVLALGTSTWTAFFHRLRDQGELLRQGHPPLEAMTSVYTGLRWMGSPDAAAMGLQALVSALVLGLVVREWSGPAPRERARVVLVLGALLFSPQGVAYDLMLLAPALALLARDARWRGAGPGTWGVLLLGWWLPFWGPSLAARLPFPWIPLTVGALLILALCRLPREEDSAADR